MRADIARLQAVSADCRFFIDVDDGCMIEQTYHNTVEILERMDEAERKAAETAMYQD